MLPQVQKSGRFTYQIVPPLLETPGIFRSHSLHEIACVVGSEIGPK
jgi:hypothetical protein